MNAADFSIGLMKSVVEENIEVYEQILSDVPKENATDPYWQRALGLFQQLSSDQRVILLEIMRQVAVDTTSNILGILDGSVHFEGRSGNFKLTDDQGQQLNGDLQSSFLEVDELKAT